MPFRAREPGVLPKLPYNRKIRNRLRSRHKDRYNAMRDATWRFLLDTLEPRILLSADLPNFGAADDNSGDQNLLVIMDEFNDAGNGGVLTQRVQVQDKDNGNNVLGTITSITGFADVGSIGDPGYVEGGINIFTGGGDDQIELQFLGTASAESFGVTIDAGTGNDSIEITSFGNNYSGDLNLTAEQITVSDATQVGGNITFTAAATETTTSANTSTNTAAITINADVTAGEDVSMNSSVTYTGTSISLVGFLADFDQTASATIVVDGDYTITGDNVSLTATTDIDITVDVTAIAVVSIALVDVETDTSVSLLNGADIAADTGDATDGAITVSATSNVDIDVDLGLLDSSFFGGTLTSFDIVASNVNIDRNTHVTITGAGQQITGTGSGATTIGATNTGSVSSDVNSLVFGAALHDFADETAQVTVSNATINAGGALGITASNTSVSDAQSKYSITSAETGVTSAVVTGSALTATTITDSATDSATYNSIADDFSYDVSGTGSTLDFGFSLGINEVNRAVTASVTGGSISATGAVSVTASNDMKLTSSVDTLALATSSTTVETTVTSFGGTLSFNEMNGDVTAFIANSEVSSATTVTVEAKNSALMDARSQAEFRIAGGSASTLGLGISFNLMGYDIGSALSITTLAIDSLLGTGLADASGDMSTYAYISNTDVNASDNVLVQASNSSLVNATVSNTASSAALSNNVLNNATSAGASFILANNKVLSKSKAEILNSAAGESVASSGGDVTVSANDTAKIASNAKIVTEATSTNDGGLTAIDQALGLLSPADFRTNGTTTLSGGLIPASVANSQEIDFGTRVSLIDDLDGLPGGGEYVPTDPTSDAAPGAVYIYLGETATINLATTNYSNKDLWKEALETNLVPTGFNLTSSDSNAVGGLVARNEVDSLASARVVDAIITADGNVNVEAKAVTENTSVGDVAGVSSGGSSINGNGDSLAAGGALVTNTVLSEALAEIVDSTVTSGGTVTVNAENSALLDAKLSNAMSAGADAVGVTVAFNTLGYAPTNLLFQAIDALIGTDIGPADSSNATARILDSTIQGTATADADVAVTANSNATLISQTDNNVTANAAAAFGASGAATGAVLASNMMDGMAEASIENSVLTTDVGAVTVDAVDAVLLNATTAMVTGSKKTNDLGVGLLNSLGAKLQQNYKLTSFSGDKTLEFGDLVYVGSNIADQEGNIYQYMGQTDTIALDGVGGTGADYTDYGLWKLTTSSNLVPAKLAGILSKAMDLAGGSAEAKYGLVSRNEAIGGATAFIHNAQVTANGDVSVSAVERATLKALEASTIQSKKAAGGIIATNTLLSEAKAYITDSQVNSTSGDLAVDALNIAVLDASTTTEMTASSDDTVVSVVIAFNSWVLMPPISSSRRSTRSLALTT